jgi:WD40 repeat protein
MGRRVISMGFDPRGIGAGRLALVTKGGTVRVWDLNAPRAAQQMIADSDQFVWSVAFDLLKNPAWRVAVAETDNVVRVWNLRAPGAKPIELRGHKGRIWTMAFGPLAEGAGLLAAARANGRVWVWDLDTPEPIRSCYPIIKGGLCPLLSSPEGPRPRSWLA